MHKLIFKGYFYVKFCGSLQIRNKTENVCQERKKYLGLIWVCRNYTIKFILVHLLVNGSMCVSVYVWGCLFGRFESRELKPKPCNS